MLDITSAVICIVGLVLYCTRRAPNEVKEIGRIMFAFGLLVLLLKFGAPVVNLGGMR